MPLRYLPRPFPPVETPDIPSSGVQGLSADSAPNHLLEEAAASLDLYHLSPPSESDAAKLGSTADLAYFMSKLQVSGNRHLCQLSHHNNCNSLSPFICHCASSPLPLGLYTHTVRPRQPLSSPRALETTLS